MNYLRIKNSVIIDRVEKIKMKEYEDRYRQEERVILCFLNNFYDIMVT